MSRLKVGDASGDNCISCGSSISADNKSPVPLCCFPCYEDQSRIEEALEESEPQVLDSEVVEEFCPETPSKTSSHGEVPSEKVVEAAPESGWMRKKREEVTGNGLRVFEHSRRDLKPANLKHTTCTAGKA